MMSYPADELDERAKKLDAKLRKLLLLFLADQISAELCRAMAREEFEEEYASLLVHIRRHYDPTAFNSKAKKIRQVLERTLADFNALIDEKEETYWETAEGKTRRITLISLWFLYALNAAATVQIGLQTGATQLEWVTQGDSRVCPVCLGFEGFYSIDDPNLPELPPHPGGRCYWVLIYRGPRFKF